MKIYLAGNFPQMIKNNGELERKTSDLVISKKRSHYRRLISFYYKKEIQSVLDLKKEEV